MEYSALLHLQANILVPRGLEPRSLRLLAVRSNQLSYETVEDTRLVSQHVRDKLGSHLEATFLNY